jgi:hypothetical protein
VFSNGSLIAVGGALLGLVGLKARSGSKIGKHASDRLPAHGWSRRAPSKQLHRAHTPAREPHPSN